MLITCCTFQAAVKRYGIAEISENTSLLSTDERQSFLP